MLSMIRHLFRFIKTSPSEKTTVTTEHAEVIIQNHLLRLTAPLLVLARACQHIERGIKLSDDYGEQLIQQFQALEKVLSTHIQNAEAIQYVRYALAAFIDEMVMSSAWSGRFDWMANALQVQYFQEHLAGEGFFTRLSALRQNAAAHLDVLEVYFTCMRLGFMGRYRAEQKEVWYALQVSVAEQLFALRHEEKDTPLTTGMARAMFFLPPVSSQRVTHVISSAIVLWVFLFGIFTWRLYAQTWSVEPLFAGYQAQVMQLFLK